MFYLKWFSWYFKYKVPAVSITRQPFVRSATITWYPGEIQWNILLIDSSTHRGAHFSQWDMCSISNGPRDNSSTRSHRVNHHSLAICSSATITWGSGELQWKTLLIDCSSHRGAHFSHWDMCSISNGSRNNSSTRSQRVSITRQPFVTSATIAWYPCELQWNTLLIDSSSHRGAHHCHWDMCSISNVLKIIQVQGPSELNITQQPFVTSATITWDPGDLQWNTLLIDCSSHRGAHFSRWDMCSISNGSRDNSSTRSQRFPLLASHLLHQPL